MKPRVLILWNQVEEDIYEHWRQEGPKPLAWDPSRTVPDVGTVAEDLEITVAAVRAAASRVDVVNVEDNLERLIAAIRLHRPDVIVNLVEYFNDDSNQEGHVAALYELFGVAYTGSDPFALTLCQNKYRTKLVLDAAGLPTSPYILVETEPVPVDHELTFPLIVKPVLEDASGGIEAASVVHDQDTLEARVRQVIKEFKMPALVEEYVDGREIHAALLGNDPPEVLPLFEMEFDDSEFNPEGEWRPQIISYRAKWDPHSPDFYSMDSMCPAQELDEETEDYIREVAAAAFKAVGCRDYGRIDMRLDEEEGEVYILEVNPNPDLSSGAAYTECAVAGDRTYIQLIGEIVDMAWQRARRMRRTARGEESVNAKLPSDHLLREWVVQKRTGSDATLPLAGTAPAAADGAGAQANAVAQGAGEAASAEVAPAVATAANAVGAVREGGDEHPPGATDEVAATQPVEAEPATAAGAAGAAATSESIAAAEAAGAMASPDIPASSAVPATPGSMAGSMAAAEAAATPESIAAAEAVETIGSAESGDRTMQTARPDGAEFDAGKGKP